MGIDRVIDVSEQDSFGCEITHGVHDLTLRLLNKDPHDTVIDNQGTVIQDLCVILKWFKIDDVDVLGNIDRLVEYRDNQGMPARTCGWITFAQDYHVLFQSPGWYLARNLTVLPEHDVRNYLQHCVAANYHTPS